MCRDSESDESMELKKLEDLKLCTEMLFFSSPFPHP